MEWPPEPALLIIDFFAPHLRGPVLKQASTQPGGVGLKAAYWQPGRTHPGKTPEDSVPAGGTTKEEHGVAPSGMLGDSWLGR